MNLVLLRNLTLSFFLNYWNLRHFYLILWLHLKAAIAPLLSYFLLLHAGLLS